MKMGQGSWRLVAVGIALALCARADTFVMKDGRRIEGKVSRETSSSYFVATGVGEIELKRADVKERILSQSVHDQYDERFAKAKTADEFAQLGTWATEQKLKSLGAKAWKRALELDAKNEVANLGLGNVLYKGEWMTPADRDKRAAADEEAEMLAKGLVRWQDRWVTPDEKSKLEQGLVLYNGKWMTVPESKHLQGLEEFEGAWLPRAEALARQDVAAVGKLVGHPLKLTLTADAAIAGDYDVPMLENTGKKLDAGRAWFDKAFRADAGLGLLGNRMAEFYLWNRDNAPFTNTVDRFASLTPTVNAAWAESVKKTHGFFWIDPYALSSARVWNRPDDDLVGHCVHHWGHMLVGRLGYDGRLLPPWYDEAVAGLTEFKVFGHNAVFCRGDAAISADAGGTRAKRAPGSVVFDKDLFHDGDWIATLKNALQANVVRPFDKLAECEFGNLELVDIATGMAIVWWLEEQNPDALSRFHAEIRKTQPKSPYRVQPDIKERKAAYEAAFKAAVKMNVHEADAAWRAWVLAK
jgi:hypothetical protein